MSADVQVIRAEPYTEVGDVLRRDAGVLLERWAVRAAAEQPGARRVHHEALLDHLPGFLEARAGRMQQAGDPEGWMRRMTPLTVRADKASYTAWREIAPISARTPV